MGVYAPQDYVVYIAILAVIVYVFLKVFERLRLDERFLKAASPYVFIGVFIRLLADTGYVEFSQWWSVTPGVYVVTVIAGSLFTAIGLLAEKTSKGRISYWTVPFTAGTLGAAYVLSLLIPYVIDLLQILYPIALAAFLTISVYCVSVLLKARLFQNRANLAIMYAHMLDASSTYIAYNFFNFSEEHLLPIFFINLAGDNAIVMIPLKLIVVSATLYYIEKWHSEEEKTDKNRTLYLVLKMVIFIIGIGPGLRNTILPALRL
jgi:uncharacterized membrane protein